MITMYEIRTFDGDVMGTLELEPFSFEPTEAGQHLVDRLGGIEKAPVMNTAAPPGGEGTAAERWDDPHQNVVKQRVARLIQAEGLKAVKVDNATT